MGGVSDLEIEEKCGSFVKRMKRCVVVPFDDSIEQDYVYCERTVVVVDEIICSEFSVKKM